MVVSAVAFFLPHCYQDAPYLAYSPRIITDGDESRIRGTGMPRGLKIPRGGSGLRGKREFSRGCTYRS